MRIICLPDTATIIALNNQGQIAGNYTSSGREHGFLWDPKCGLCDIGSLGGNVTHICDLNDHGQIVGQSECTTISKVDGQPECHAFLWQCGTICDLGALTGDLGIAGDKSIATGINNHGQIIGSSNYLLASKGKFLKSEDRAVIWENFQIKEFNEGFDGRIELLGINDAGYVSCRIDSYRSPFHPSLSSSSSCLIDLATRCIWDACRGGSNQMKLNSKGILIADNFMFSGDLSPFAEPNKYVKILNDYREPISNIFDQVKDNPWRDFVGAFDLNP